MLNETEYIWIYVMFCFYGNLDFKILYRADDNKFIECIYFTVIYFIYCDLRPSVCLSQLFIILSLMDFDLSNEIRLAI
jgi:hypothetical protein